MNISGSLGLNGLKDWLIQRFTALFLTFYTLFWCVYLLKTPEINYSGWKLLLSGTGMKLATIVALLCLMVHAWVGIWTVCTDYIKIAALRVFVLAAFFFGLTFSLFWGIFILWSK